MREWHGAGMYDTLCKSGIAFFPLKNQKSLDPLVALPSALCLVNDLGLACKKQG